MTETEMNEIHILEDDPDYSFSLDIVKDVFKDELYDLTEEDLSDLTKEIMSMIRLIGGECDEDNVRFYANEYINKNFYYRFKKVRGQL